MGKRRRGGRKEEGQIKEKGDETREKRGVEELIRGVGETEEGGRKEKMGEIKETENGGEKGNGGKKTKNYREKGSNRTQRIN